MKSVGRALLVAAVTISSLFAIVAPAHAAIYCEKHPVDVGDERVAFVYICVDDTAENWTVHATTSVGGGTGASVSQNTGEGEVVTNTVCLYYPWRDGPATLCKDVVWNQ